MTTVDYSFAHTGARAFEPRGSYRVRRLITEDTRTPRTLERRSEFATAVPHLRHSRTTNCGSLGGRAHPSGIR